MNTKTCAARLVKSPGVVVGGFLVMNWGLHWDIAVHADKGRDTFVSAPHLLTVFGAYLASTIAAIRLFVLRPEDSPNRLGLKLVLAVAPLTALVLALDELWHQLLGLDLTIWSPPHLLLIFVVTLGSVGAWLNALAARSAAATVSAVVAVQMSLNLALMEYQYGIPHFPAQYEVIVVGAFFGALLRMLLISSRSFGPRVVAWGYAGSYFACLAVFLGLNSIFSRALPVHPVGLTVSLALAVILSGSLPNETKSRSWRSRSLLEIGIGASTLVLAFITIAAVRDVYGVVNWSQIGFVWYGLGALLAVLVMCWPDSGMGSKRLPSALWFAPSVLIALAIYATGIPLMDASASEQRLPSRISVVDGDLVVETEPPITPDIAILMESVSDDRSTFSRVAILEHGPAGQLRSVAPTGTWTLVWIVDGTTTWQRVLQTSEIDSLGVRTDLARRSFAPDEAQIRWWFRPASLAVSIVVAGLAWLTLLRELRELPSAVSVRRQRDN